MHDFDDRDQALIDAYFAEEARAEPQIDVAVFSKGVEEKLYAKIHVPQRQQNHWKVWSIGIAACIAMVFGIHAYLPNWQNTTRVQTQSYATQPGQRATITLNDGTKVTLNAATTLAFAQDAKAGRTVTLQGEAIFTVAHAGSQPFTVIADGARTTVLGTTFGVRKYPTDSATRIGVVDGKVSVNGNALLSARDVALVSSGSQTLITRNVNVAELLEWNRGKITFRNTPLSSALEELSRAYGVTLVVNDPVLADAKVRLTANTNEDIRSVLDAIARVLGGSVVQQGNRFEIISTGR